MIGAIRSWLTTCALMGCVSGHTMRYSDIEMLGGRTCPFRDSCPLIQPNGNFSERNCECDSRCSFYDDCCIDAAAPARTVVRSRAVCMPIGGTNLGAYMEATCPDGHPLTAQCRNDDFSDPFLSTPVTDERARRTYRNHYCALCNSAGTRLQPWTARVDCPNAGNYTFADMTFGPTGWTVRGHDCELLFFWPPGLKSGPRLCRANLTDTCPPHYRRRTHVQACRAYLAVVMGADGVLYRNPHCALCNGNTVDDISCNLSILSRGGKPFSFALLLDVNRSDGDLVGVSGPEETCPSGQKYDPYFKKCRNLVCAVPGYKMSGGKCVKK